MTSGSRRESHEWGAQSSPAEAAVDVLIPTKDRAPELTATLAGLAAQDDPPFRVIVSDQSDAGVAVESPAVQSMARILRAQGREVIVDRHLPRRGMAEHRQYLLSRSTGPRVLFLDDDVWLEPGALRRMSDALDTLACGFVGLAVQGLSFLDDRRPHETSGFEPWPDHVEPENLARASDVDQRVALHNAANLAHIAPSVPLPERGWIAYKVAWVGACVMFRRDALVESGGFDFWHRLPAHHVGEDVAAQWRVMELFGGAGLLPSGAVHVESPTTLPDRRVNAAMSAAGDQERTRSKGASLERGA